MALDTFDFEGPADQLIAGTGIALQGTGTAVYDASWSVSGGTSGRFMNNASSTRQARCTVTTSASTFSWQGFFKVPSPLPAAGVRATVASLRYSAGVAVRVTVDENGVAGFESSTGGVFTPVSAALTAGTPFRFTLRGVIGTTTSNSTATAKAYTGATFSTQSGSTVTGTAYNFGTAPVTAMDIGSITSTYQYTTYADYVQYQDGSTTELTVPAGASAPTANAGSDQYVMSGTAATLTGSGTIGAGGGSINGYSWVNTERPPGASTPSIVSPGSSTTQVNGLVKGVYRFALTVGQTGGSLSSTPDEVVVWVYPVSGDDVLVYSETHASGITNEGGATSITAALNDTSAVTRAQWPASPAGEVITLTMCPFGPGPISVILDGYYDTNPATRTVTWLAEDGTTVIDGPYPYALTAVNTGVETAIDSDGMTALGTAQSARRALKVRIADAVT